ncbi:MAG: EthD domain-containing protein [Lysobacterales bacterium]
MIKLNYYVRRKPGMSVDDFQQYWKDSHGPLWAKFADLLGVRRYVQVADLPDHPISAGYKEGYRVVGEPYDGVAVACWAEIAVLEDALATSEGREAWSAILEDEGQFIDHQRSMLSFGTDHAVINPRGKLVASEQSDLLRGIYFPRGLEGLELPELQRHWIAIHGGLTHDFSEHSPNMRYFQVHAVDNAVADAMRKARGMKKAPNYFGHAEIWTCPAEVEKAAQSPRRTELFPYYIADIEAFCDMDTGYFVMGKEDYFVDKDIYTLPLPQPAFTPSKVQKTGT